MLHFYTLPHIRYQFGAHRLVTVQWRAHRHNSNSAVCSNISKSEKYSGTVFHSRRPGQYIFYLYYKMIVGDVHGYKYYRNWGDDSKICGKFGEYQFSTCPSNHLALARWVQFASPRPLTQSKMVSARLCAPALSISKYHKRSCDPSLSRYSKPY